MRRAIRSKRAVTAEGIRPATIVYENERIIAVESLGIDIGEVPAFEVGDFCLLPGLVDTHIHINEPGRTEWEGFATASRAAAAGGYTCLVDMPLNCIPATTDAPALEAKRQAAARDSLVDYAFWGGAVPGNAHQLLSLAQSGVKGFKCFTINSGVAEFESVGETDLRAAMPIIAKSGLPLLAHAEDPEVIAAAARLTPNDPRRYISYLHSRPPEAEMVAIERMISLCREYGCRVHIVHLSAAAALPLLRAARAEGLPITVETCPHYLYFAAARIAEGATQFKCAPPIRDEANREQLWEALREGLIDLIATDHSPCPPDLKLLKLGDFFQAWGGIASVSLALPVVWTAAKTRGFTLTDIVRWMSEGPACLARLNGRKGRIAVGYDADFAVFDPDAAFTAQPSHLFFRHPITPYLGEALQGRVVQSFVRGRPVFDHGTFDDSDRGRECTVNEWSTAS